MPVFPVPLLKGVAPRISDSYGYSEVRGRLHAGSDIMYRRPEPGVEKLPVFAKHYHMPDGIPALAYDAGVVTRSGQIGTGGRVEIDHGGGIVTKYYHLVGLKVSAGDRVKAGQPVGIISHNPASYKLNHLHFEVLKNGKTVDPAAFLKASTMVKAPSSPILAAGLAVGAAVGAYFLFIK
jgi:murein DD-endopeptidase MepM/ murein hydrolase activator NlpD